MLHHRIKNALEKTLPLEFAVLLLTGMALHLLPTLAFDGFATGWPPMAQREVGVLVTVAVSSILLLKPAGNPLIWLALLGFLVFETICLLAHHLLPPQGHAEVWMVLALVGLGFALWKIYEYAKQCSVDHPDVSGQHQISHALALSDDAHPGAAGDAVPKIPVIGELDFIHKTDALVLFLSVPPPEIANLIASLREDAHLGDVASFAALRSCNWYMPLVAIHTHIAAPHVHNPRASHQLRVCVIPSADSKRPGSYRDAERFLELVRRLARPRAWNVEISVLPRHQSGVRYENLSALSKAIHFAKEHLKADVPSGQVLVDITSGQAICSAAAAALTVHRKECFQYVSTEDYTVRLYDLRLEPAPSPFSGE